MPQGALLAARTDDQHWLTAGCGEYVPIMYDGDVPLIATGGVEAPVRLGAYCPVDGDRRVQPGAAAPAGPTSSARIPPTGTGPNTTQPSDGDSARAAGAFVPSGYELRLRMSGLFWPEAADRLAHTAYVTRERIGNGQVILFATTPTFRAAAAGTTRLLANAVILGPGMGASPTLALNPTR